MPVVCQVELDHFSVKCNELSCSVHCGVCGFCTASGSTFYHLHFCVAALLENRCVLSCTEIAGFSLGLHFHVGMEPFEFASFFKVHWCQDFNNDLKIWINFMASGFWC